MSSLYESSLISPSFTKLSTTFFASFKSPTGTVKSIFVAPSCALFWIIISTFTSAVANLLKMSDAIPGRSLTPISEIRAWSLSNAIPLTNGASIMFSSSVINVPSSFEKLVLVTKFTPSFFAISTERFCRTFAPSEASSNISS